MSEEFKLLRSATSGIEEELNRLGAEGWTALNCWPEGTSEMVCVLKRTLEFWDTASRSFRPCRPLSALTLDYALARCEDTELNKFGNYAIKLAELGLEFGADQAAIFEHLKSKGLKSNEGYTDTIAGFVQKHRLSVKIKPDVNGHQWLNATPPKDDKPAVAKASAGSKTPTDPV